MPFRVPSSITAKLFNLKGSLGSAGLHNLYPNEFEYYTISLELMDSNKKTTDFFVFPITPQSIKVSKTQIKTIKKSQFGISTYKNSTFSPLGINLTGNFGRALKY